MLSNPAPPEIYYEDYDSIVNAPPCSPSKFPQENETDEVSEEELERCRLLAKLSGPRPESEMLQNDGTIRRKVSEILLGKATIDIRRCSSISAYIRRPRAAKNALVRRQSLFQSFRKYVQIFDKFNIIFQEFSSKKTHKFSRMQCESFQLNEYA